MCLLGIVVALQFTERRKIDQALGNDYDHDCECDSEKGIIAVKKLVMWTELSVDYGQVPTERGRGEAKKRDRPFTVNPSKNKPPKNS